MGAFDVGILKNAARAAHHIAYTFVAFLQCEVATEEHFSGYAHKLLGFISRACAHLNHVVGFQHEPFPLADCESVFNRHAVDCGETLCRLCGSRVDYSAGNVDAGCRCSLEKAAGLEDKVFESGVVGKRVCAGTGNLAGDGEASAVFKFMHA